MPTFLPMIRIKSRYLRRKKHKARLYHNSLKPTSTTVPHLKMKLSALVLVALAALGLAEEVTEIKCDTSRASPMLHHVNELIGNMKDAKKEASICTDHSLPGEARKCEKTEQEWTSENGGAVFQLCKGWNGKQGFRVSAFSFSSPQPRPLLGSNMMELAVADKYRPPNR